MKHIFIISFLLGLGAITFNGCGDTNSDNNSTDSIDKSVCLSGDDPHIFLYGETDIEITLGTNTVLENGDSFEACDPQDGDISNSVQRHNNIDFTRAGRYEIAYDVTDSDGNSAQTQYRTVTIIDTNSNGNSNPNTIYTNPDYVYDDEPTEDYTNGSSGGVDLGTAVGDNSNYNQNSSTQLDDFLSWYNNTCGRDDFNYNLYNASTRVYKGKIDCSHNKLYSIDLTPLSIFNGIDTLDLSYNNLSDIDFTPIRDINELWHLWINNNTTTLKKKYDTVAERNALFRFFTNIHGGDGNTGGENAGLYIHFKPQNLDIRAKSLEN